MNFTLSTANTVFSGRLNRCKANIRVTMVKNSLLREYVASTNKEKQTKKLLVQIAKKKKIKKGKVLIGMCKASYHKIFKSSCEKFEIGIVLKELKMEKNI